MHKHMLRQTKSILVYIKTYKKDKYINIYIIFVCMYVVMYVYTNRFNIFTFITSQKPFLYKTCLNINVFVQYIYIYIYMYYVQQKELLTKELPRTRPHKAAQGILANKLQLIQALANASYGFLIILIDFY